MLRFALILALLLWPEAALRAETVVIRNDSGGNVLQYQARRRQLAKADLVRIHGRCDSACTIFLSLPNACIGRKAVFGFHGASPKTGHAAVDYFLDMQLAKFYRGSLRQRFLTDWRFHLGSKDLVYVTADQLVKLDPKIRFCPPNPPKKP